jgi:hypothetical protein
MSLGNQAICPSNHSTQSNQQPCPISMQKKHHYPTSQTDQFDDNEQHLLALHG